MKLPEHLSAEDVKQVLEAYQREHFPEGRCASAMFDAGALKPAEVLVVVVTSRPCHPQPSS